MFDWFLDTPLKTSQKSIMSLRKICPYSELFWSVFSRIWTEYGEILRISPYSVRMRENADYNKSEYGHLSRNVSLRLKNHLYVFLKNLTNIYIFKKIFLVQ